MTTQHPISRGDLAVFASSCKLALSILEGKTGFDLTEYETERIRLELQAMLKVCSSANHMIS